MAMLIVVLGVVTIFRMPTDIFPNIDIPVIAVVWSTTPACPPTRWRSASSRSFERLLTTTVNDIEHIESQSLNGVGVIKILLPAGRQDRAGRRAGDGDLADGPAADAAGHAAAVHHSLQRLERADPADRRQQRHAHRAAALRLRRSTSFAPQLAHGPGRADPAAVRRQAAAGHGRSRPGAAVRLRPLARATCSNAINAQNLILPAGTAKIGDAGISGQAQQQPRRGRGVQRHPDQDRERHDGLHQGRRPRPRRLRGADQRRPRATAKRGVLMTILKSGERLDARRGRAQSSKALPDDPGAAAAGTEDRRRCSTSRCSSGRRSRAW